MNQTGDWYATTAPENKYQYNGKELSEELGLNWNDYGARYYDPAIARFPSIDRFAEEFNFQTPYAYAQNNPILFLEINGDSIAPPGNGLSFKNFVQGIKWVYGQKLPNALGLSSVDEWFDEGTPKSEDYHDSGDTQPGGVEVMTGSSKKSAGTADTPESKNGSTDIVDGMPTPAGGGASSTYGPPNVVSTVVSYHEGVGTSDKLWTKDWAVRQPSFDSPMTTYDGTTFSHNGKDTITRVSWNGNGRRDTMKYIKYQKFMKKDSIRVVSETRNK